MPYRIMFITLVATFAVGCGSGNKLTPDGDAGMDADMDANEDADLSACLGVSSTGGGPCGCDLDCPAGGFCVTEEETGFPHGFCYVECDLEEEHEELLCVELAGGAGVFFEGCDGDRACRAGWICAVHSETMIGRCETRCSNDAHCLTGDCNLYTGLCEPETEGGGVEAPCTLDEDCKSFGCVGGDSDDGWCMVGCNADDEVCPDEAYCQPIGTQPGDNRGVCFLL